MSKARFESVDSAIGRFLAEHCTQMDDHDAAPCRKCQEMREQLKDYTARVLQGMKEQVLEEIFVDQPYQAGDYAQGFMAAQARIAARVRALAGEK